MNKFEQEALELLRVKFDKVIWMSKKKNSTFDFKCIKDGNVYWIEAKESKTGRIELLPTQKNADGVVAKINGEIKFIDKSQFGEEVYIKKGSLIKIDYKLKQKLDLLKIHPRESYSDVIKRNL